MSWDYLSTVSCSHVQIKERYTLDVFDFKTLHYAANPVYNMRAPINGTDQVKVFLRGVLISPTDPILGYSVVPDPDRIETNYTFSKIIFNKPVRMVQPLIEVTYPTRPVFCMKCAGVNTVNDWSNTPAGQLARVTQTNKLVQQCLKYLLTSVNPFNPNLSCRIKSYIAAKMGSNITDDINNEVVRALGAYQTIQNAQQTVQTLDPEEVLKDITGIAVRQDPTNPMLVYLTTQVAAYGSRQNIPLNVALQANS